MKLGKVKSGEKFVLDDRGGVWEMIGIDPSGYMRARCSFGPRGVFGTEVVVDPNAYCYVIFEGRPVPFGKEAGQWSGGDQSPEDDASKKTRTISTSTRIRIVDEATDELLAEISNPTMHQIVILSSSETIRLTPHGKRRARVYQVIESPYDMDEDILYVMVLTEKVGGKDEDDESEIGKNQHRNRESSVRRGANHEAVGQRAERTEGTDNAAPSPASGTV